MLLDFLPIILFFLTFKYAESRADEAALMASQHFGFLVSGGVVDSATAPVLLATLVVMAATLAQVGILAARRQPIQPMLWIGLVLIVVLGGATVWFHSETFIKWKPTLLYGAMAGALLIGRWVWQRNFIRSLMGSQLTLPEAVWWQLNSAWSAFFLAMGALNLWVAYSFETSVWVNFKLFGGIGLLLAFSVAQALYLSPFLQREADSPAAQGGGEAAGASRVGDAAAGDRGKAT